MAGTVLSTANYVVAVYDLILELADRLIRTVGTQESNLKLLGVFLPCPLDFGVPDLT